jgi:hypothetical protein
MFKFYCEILRLDSESKQAMPMGRFKDMKKCLNKLKELKELHPELRYTFEVTEV